MKLALAFGVVLTLMACSSPTAANPSAQPQPHLRIAAGLSTPASLFVFLAADRGLYAKHGVTVDVNYMSGQAQMQSLVAGDSEAALHVGADVMPTACSTGASSTTPRAAD